MGAGPAWWFYQIEGVDLSVALAPLLEKSLERGWSVGILSPNSARLAELDGALWTQEPGGFLPHGLTQPEDQPIFLSDDFSTLKDRDGIILLDGADWTDPAVRVSRLMVMFDAHDVDVRVSARDQYKRAKDAGLEVAFYVYRPGEGWSKQA
mgnify:CR=1 FL=1|jgi:DNA polymerase III subunit chi